MRETNYTATPGFTAVEKDVWEPTLSLFHRLMIRLASSSWTQGFFFALTSLPSLFSIAPTVKARNRAAIGLLMVFCALARRAERESEEGRIENYDSLSKVAVKVRPSSEKCYRFPNIVRVMGTRLWSFSLITAKRARSTRELSTRLKASSPSSRLSSPSSSACFRESIAQQ